MTVVTGVFRAAGGISFSIALVLRSILAFLAGGALAGLLVVLKDMALP